MSEPLRIAHLIDREFMNRHGVREDMERRSLHKLGYAYAKENATKEVFLVHRTSTGALVDLDVINPFMEFVGEKTAYTLGLKPKPKSEGKQNDSR